MLEKPWVTVPWQERGKMPFQPNVVILKGRAIDRSLPQTMVHIFSQWGSLVCEQGSGRAVNRPLYEALRGELGRQWRGLSHVCHVSTLGPGLFVLMAARDWRDLFTLDVCQAGEFPLHEKLTSQIASEPTGAIHLQSKLLGSHLICCVEIMSPGSLKIWIMHLQDTRVFHNVAQRSLLCKSVCPCCVLVDVLFLLLKWQFKSEHMLKMSFTGLQPW